MFQSCTDHWPVSSGIGGRGGAAFIGKRSSLVVEDSIITDSYAGRAGGGMYSDEGGSLDLAGVSFLDASSGVCPDPEIVIVCVPNDWADSWGDDCEAYAANPGWCGYEESSDNCCVCGAGQETKSCEPVGAGGGYYAATLVSVTMKAVDFQRCSSGLAGATRAEALTVPPCTSQSTEPASALLPAPMTRP